MATATAESILGGIKTRLEAQIAGIHVTDQIDAITADPNALAHKGVALLRVGDTVADEYPTRRRGLIRVVDTIQVQTAWRVDPRDQITSRDDCLARGRAIREALTGTWGDVDTRRAVYAGSEGPARHPASAEWLVLVQTFEFSRFASLGS
jgi:hypothetical protein